LRLICGFWNLNGGGCGWSEFGGQGFEPLAAFAQGEIEEELAVGVEEVEGHENDRDLAAHVFVDLLAADALAEDGEGKGFVGGEIPAEDFAV